MANADTPDDALTARNNGAEGIGLCRTEHMVYMHLSFELQFYFLTTTRILGCLIGISFRV
jgi:hypothetical protein